VIFLKPLWAKRLTGLVLTCLLLGIASWTSFLDMSLIPNELRFSAGSVQQLPKLPFTTVHTTNADVLSIQESDAIAASTAFSFQANQTGEAALKVKLFDRLPIKTVRVDVLPDIRLVPGGHSIGVQLKSAGVMVVGHHQFENTAYQQVSPGKKANIQVGDLIVKLNGKPIASAEEFTRQIQAAGENAEPVQLELLRGKERLHLSLQPEQNRISGKFQVGLFVRDSAAGVGTLTFYHPEKKVYGALGHIITDNDTQKPVVVGGGKILLSHVSSIQRGESGTPGQKRAFFYHDKPIGNIEKNTPFGIFGQMERIPDNGYTTEPMPVAYSEDVKKGPADILTVVEGEKVEKYGIEIVDVFPQRYPATKGMIIRVTDPKLLEKTGGIVQGMSGSPIIQDGCLVGAVTHVFVNDPTSGYATFIEWMLRDAGLIPDSSGTNEMSPNFFAKGKEYRPDCRTVM